MSKIAKNKTKYPKKTAISIRVPNAWVVEATGASIDMVKKVRSGAIEGTGVKGQQITMSCMLFEQEASIMITRVKELVRL